MFPSWRTRRVTSSRSGFPNSTHIGYRPTPHLTLPRPPLPYYALWKLRRQTQRDLKRENALLFIRNALSFRDFWMASKYGDIGRCIHIMDTWTCQFIGAGQHRYAHELMEIKCGFKSEYDPRLKELIEKNWLVNLHGKPGKWMAVDMQQENMVLHI
jgi:hypothetical protein